MRLVALLLFPALFTVLLRAQESTGSITGRIFDATGSAVSGAEITATQTENGMTRKAKSGRDGSYTFSHLPIRPYQLTASHTRIQKSVEQGMQPHRSRHVGPDIPPHV